MCLMALAMQAEALLAASCCTPLHSTRMLTVSYMGLLHLSSCQLQVYP